MHFTVITIVFMFRLKFSKSKRAKITSNKGYVSDHLIASLNTNVCHLIAR